MVASSLNELKRETVKALRAMAASLGMRGYSALRKAELIERILLHKEQNSMGKEEKNAEVTEASQHGEKNSHPEKESKALSKRSSSSASKKRRVKASVTAEKKKPKHGKLNSSDAVELTSKVNNAKAKVPEKKEEEPSKAEKKAKEPLVEPGVGFIDRGAILPQYAEGTRLRTLIIDPNHTYVYWDCEQANEGGWEVSAYDESGALLQSFRSQDFRAGGGYFTVPSDWIKQVVLRPVHHGVAANDITLSSEVTLKKQIPTSHDLECWRDFPTRDLISQAPSAGRAPQQKRSLWQGDSHQQNADMQLDEQYGSSMSSRFRAPSRWRANAPSSDTLLSSDSLVKKR